MFQQALEAVSKQSLVRTRTYRSGRAVQAGRVRPIVTTSIRPTRRSVATKSGIGRKNRKMMLDHYRQTKNLLVSYSPRAVGFF